ncbi:hypothetical protein ABIE67_009708 [Streptomyces sp. V4I8]|uniref:hypothetical protein n=1 Tax=Streptomyces sp. V4I8 TaxID=3156469 RepID=UPI0035196C9A
MLVIAHPEKQDAAATWKKAFNHHPLMGFVDHGRCGSGEPRVIAKFVDCALAQVS